MAYIRRPTRNGRSVFNLDDGVDVASSLLTIDLDPEAGTIMVINGVAAPKNKKLSEEDHVCLFAPTGGG